MNLENLPATSHYPRILDACPPHRATPRLIVFAGIHGNEPSGVLALHRIFEQLRYQNIVLKGQLVGIIGNREALRREVRYCDGDLNRLFMAEYIEQVSLDKGTFPVEDVELSEICTWVESYETDGVKYPYFVDCHTTSAASIPYISLNEGFLDSYHFAQDMPATTVVGVEKEIKGCLAEWLNLRGWHGFTFEAGQHQATVSVQNQEAIIWLALIHSGCLEESQAPLPVQQARETLYQQGSQQHRAYRVTSSYRIREDEDFRMQPGFVNLQAIQKGEHLATSDGQPIYAQVDAHMLMPLYQKQGNYGFFIAEEIEDTALN